MAVTIERLPSGRYRAIVRMGGKRRTVKSAPLRRDAVAAGAKLEAEMRGARIADPSAPDRPETLSDVVEALLVGKGLAESTRSDYRRVWRKLSEFDPTVPATKVDAVDAAWVNRLYSRLADHIAPVEMIEPTKPKSGPTRTRPIRPARAADQWSEHRIRRVHEVCAAAWSRLVRVGDLPANPFAAAGKPSVERQRPKYPTTAQVGVLLATANRLSNEWAGDRRRSPAIAAQLPLYVQLLAMTGARKGELVAARWEHVHLETHPPTLDVFVSHSYATTNGGTRSRHPQRRIGFGAGISVRQTKTGSAGQRTISIDTETAAALQAVLDRREHQWPSQYVLSLADDGITPWTPSYAGRMFAKVREIAGLPWIDGHHLRHWHATQRLDAGEPAVLVAQRLGHSDATTTQRIYRYAGAGVDAPGTDRLAASLAEAEWEATHPDEVAYRNAVWAGLLPRRRSASSSDHWAQSREDETPADRWKQRDDDHLSGELQDPWTGKSAGSPSDEGRTQRRLPDGTFRRA